MLEVWILATTVCVLTSMHSVGVETMTSMEHWVSQSALCAVKGCTRKALLHRGRKQRSFSSAAFLAEKDTFPDDI